MLEHDQRQYSLMLELLGRYRDNKIDTHGFAESMYGLLDALQEPDGEWKASFLKLWDVVEVALAYQQGKNMPGMRPDHLGLVQKAGADLRVLVLSKRPA